MSDYDTSADPEALGDGAANIEKVALEARDLMADFTTALNSYGGVVDDSVDGTGGSKSANGGDYVEIWRTSVVPGQEYALEFLSQLDTVIGGVGEQTRGTANKLAETEGDAGSTAVGS